MIAERLADVVALDEVVAVAVLDRRHRPAAVAAPEWLDDTTLSDVARRAEAALSALDAALPGCTEAVLTFELAVLVARRCQTGLLLVLAEGASDLPLVRAASAALRAVVDDSDVEALAAAWTPRVPTPPAPPAAAAPVAEVPDQRKRRLGVWA